MCYRISDTGIGMSPEFLKHIFDEFAQEGSSARTQYKGTGLGMAITRHYVDGMGGNISVESEKGRGSVFTVELPLELSDKCPEETQNAQPVELSDLAGIRVMLAEDNDLNAEIVVTQLEEYQMKITRVSNGKEAAELFEQEPEGTFDIILMDIMKPGMNGYDAARAIRSDSRHPQGRTIPIIAMTANAFAEDIQKSLEAGMNAHLAKPVVMDEVIRCIAECLK